MIEKQNTRICSILEKPCEYIENCPIKEKPNQDQIKAIGLFRTLRPDIV
ncbi:MAG: hypothetical protein II787_00780 [Lachnospiraceae bacterium]|nr:hypothetical protein [Lachnospiraceae bacterium]